MNELDDLLADFPEGFAWNPQHAKDGGTAYRLTERGRDALLLQGVRALQRIDERLARIEKQVAGGKLTEGDHDN